MERPAPSLYIRALADHGGLLETHTNGKEVGHGEM
jgi:hypothetical protein